MIECCEVSANVSDDALAGDGETADRGAVKRVRAEVRAENAERWRKRGRAGR